MKSILISMFLLIGTLAFSQKVDTVIVQKCYKSYFSKKYKEPCYVSYYLHACPQKSECSRAAYHFSNDIKGLPTSTPKGYSHSGYDEGHMADAADFSAKGKCELEESTFRFYNALPQTPELNRGIWKVWETTIRKESLSDSLYVQCGGIFDAALPQYLADGAMIPTKCWKVVRSAKTGKVLHVLLFTNTANPAVTDLKTIEALEKLLPYKID